MNGLGNYFKDLLKARFVLALLKRSCLAVLVWALLSLRLVAGPPNILLIFTDDQWL